MVCFTWDSDRGVASLSFSLYFVASYVLVMITSSGKVLQYHGKKLCVRCNRIAKAKDIPDSCVD